MTYAEKLRSPAWQKRRLEIMGRAGFRCEKCGAGDKALNVHHGYYEKGLEPWEYPDSALWCLCEDCHLATQELLSAVVRAFGSIHPKDLSFMLGVCLDAWTNLAAGEPVAAVLTEGNAKEAA